MQSVPKCVMCDVCARECSTIYTHKSSRRIQEKMGTAMASCEGLGVGVEGHLLSTLFSPVTFEFRLFYPFNK